MKRTSKRVLSGLMAVAISSSIAPFFSAPTASAAGVPQPGGATVKTAGGGADLSSGTSDTTFTLRLPAGASCGGDSANDGYRVQSYMVPASVDPSTLTFDASGPVPNTLGAGFRQPLYDTTGSPYVDAQTANAAAPPGPGPIINIPDFNYGAVFVPGNIPAGAYNLGIACTQGPAGPNQMKEFWNVTKTFTTSAAGGTAEVNWSVGAVPSAPTLTTVTGGDATLTAAFTPIASTPATTGFTVTATPTVGAPVTATGASSPITVSGLTNGTQYSVTVRATNSTGDSVESNALTGTPNPARPAVTGLTAVPGAGALSIDWAYAGPAVTGYSVTSSPEAGTVVVDTANTSAEITGLTPGTVQTITVTPTYSTAPAGTPTSITAAANSAAVVNQQIEVTRPVGALVLTQRCGVFGALDAETAPEPGFPTGFAAAGATGGTVGTAPFTDWVNAAGPGTNGTGTVQDTANFGGYPYPVDPATQESTAVYATNCGVELGVGKFITSGPGAGQFFATSGRLNQVTVVDTRDSNPQGWALNGNMNDFVVAGGGASFSGNHLGWTPKMTDDSDPFDHDLDPTTADYDQVVAQGGAVAARTAPGLKQGRTLASAVDGSDLGIAVLDARLKLLIPVTARNGRYTGTLAFTVI
jgi:hypothetical protein